jgi:hypothetical protein
MSAHQWLGIGAIVAIVAFVWFTFRQGLAVKPSRRTDHGSSVGYGDESGDGGGAGHHG